MKTLTDKWALITGSTRGIGQQIAMGLAERGCNVVVHGRQMANTSETLEMLAAYPVEVRAVAGDLASPEGVQAVIDGVHADAGAIDILYNNAAIQNPWKEIWDLTHEDWLESFQINFFAIVQLCTAFAPGMRERGFGRIINLTSGVKGTPQLAPYSATKAAVDKYTRDLAAELEGSNVLVNTLDPGWLRTDMGGERAPGEVTSVLPGALVPALLRDNGPSGRFYAAQDYRMLER